MTLCPPLSPSQLADEIADAQSLMTYWHQMTRLTIVTLRQRRRSMVAYPDQAEVVRAEAADLAACRTEVRENGCGRIAMWRGHGIERLS